MRPIWSESRLLVFILIIAALLFAFGLIAEEVVEGEPLWFDRTVMLAFRDAADLVGKSASGLHSHYCGASFRIRSHRGGGGRRRAVVVRPDRDAGLSRCGQSGRKVGFWSSFSLLRRFFSHSVSSRRRWSKASRCGSTGP